MSDDNKVVTLGGVPFPVSSGTGADIIKVLEDVLAQAKGGKMVGLAIVTLMERDRSAATVHSCEYGYHTELLGCADILMQRLRNRVLEDAP